MRRCGFVWGPLLRFARSEGGLDWPAIRDGHIPLRTGSEQRLDTLDQIAAGSFSQVGLFRKTSKDETQDEKPNNVRPPIQRLSTGWVHKLKANHRPTGAEGTEIFLEAFTPGKKPLCPASDCGLRRWR